MTAKLYKVVQDNLIANLDPEAGLFAVIIGSLENTDLTDEEIKECEALLTVMLGAVEAFVRGLRPMTSGDSSNN